MIGVRRRTPWWRMRTSTSLALVLASLLAEVVFLALILYGVVHFL